MSSGKLTQRALKSLDWLARMTHRRPRSAPHLATGGRGEEVAYFFLRRQGYVMVARNFRTPRRRGEIDLIGWEGGTLCFIEVKTRSSRAVAPAEAAVDEEKQRELAGMAREYLRRARPAPGRGAGKAAPWPPPVRLDVVSVYLEPGKAEEITLFKNAFALT